MWRRRGSAILEAAKPPEHADDLTANRNGGRVGTNLTAILWILLIRTGLFAVWKFTLGLCAANVGIKSLQTDHFARSANWITSYRMNSYCDAGGYFDSGGAEGRARSWFRTGHPGPAKRDRPCGPSRYQARPAVILLSAWQLCMATGHRTMVKPTYWRIFWQVRILPRSPIWVCR